MNSSGDRCSRSLRQRRPRGPGDSPVWVLWENSSIWMFGSRRTDTFPQRIERDARCAIGIVDFDRAAGLVEHAGFRGRATIEPFETERARRLLARYLGADEARWDRRFRETLVDSSNVFVQFTADTVVARDISYAAGVG